MTYENPRAGNSTTTEELYIGFRKKPTTLEAVLVTQECAPLTYKKNAGREPGSRYRMIDVKSGGGVYLLYQEGAGINADFSPARHEGNIAAILRVNITTGIIQGRGDKSLVEMRDSLVAYVLDTYGASAGAFVYFPQPVAKRETA